MIHWNWKAYHALTLDELYAVLQLRQKIFVIEQQCIYDDIDGRDSSAQHLLGWCTQADSSAQIGAYLRLFAPDEGIGEIVIGRVLIAPEFRAQGFGTALMREALNRVVRDFPACPVRLSAQCYLIDFYAGLGFATASEPYEEDGIPHIDMRKK